MSISWKPFMFTNIIRIPKLQEDAQDRTHAMSALICVASVMQKYRLLSRHEEFASNGIHIEKLEQLDILFEGGQEIIRIRVDGDDDNDAGVDDGAYVTSTYRRRIRRCFPLAGFKYTIGFVAFCTVVFGLTLSKERPEQF